jgi:hypothetical protein
MFYRENINEKMKNYLYCNSIAAHPYYLIGNRFRGHRLEGLCKLSTLDIYTNINKMMKKAGEALT